MDVKPMRLWWLAARVLATVAVALLPAMAHAGPVNVILDTDIGPDCDDVGAVCVLHALADQGEARILAMVCCTGSEWGAPCLDALNTYFGHADIPVGTLKDAAGFLENSGYNRLIAQRYPHRLQSGRDAPDATALYRRILASQPDRSVAIAAIGPLRNLSQLLKSAPDQHSPLAGKDLVARKVTFLSCMGGWYPSVPRGWGPEWNFAQDEKATRDVCENWPTPILFSGAEIGSGIMTGRRLAIDAPEYHPLTMAFADSADVGFGADRSSWDQTSSLIVVRGVRKYWKESKAGYNRAGDKGANTFTTDQDRGHRYIERLMPVSPLEDVIEDLMLGAREGPLNFDYNIASYCSQGFGFASARDEASANTAARNAFDRDPRTAWAAGSFDSWIQYQCPDGRKYVVSKYRLVSADGPFENDPAAWTLSASNDNGTTWSVLDIRREETFSGRGQVRQFVCDNTAAYNIYRLQFKGEHPVRVAGIELLEHVDNAAGVTVTGIHLDLASLSVPVAGRAALNASVLPGNALGKTVVWSSNDPAVAIVKRIGKNTAIVSGIGVGTCMIRAETLDGHRIASCQVSVMPSTLPAGWVYEEVNSPHVPGCAEHRDGVFTVTGGGLAIERWWQRIWDQFALLSRTASGDGAIVVRLTSQTHSNPKAIAGVMYRETLARDSKFVMLGRHPDGELLMSWRDGPEDEGPRKQLGKVTLPVWLKLERRGTSFNAYVSKDGADWGKPAASHTGRLFPRSLKAGLCVTARNNTMTSTAVFDHVTLEASP
ncbi:MAG: nucleoside hydrolase [Planctomycetota bacterium]|nr:nucleoside hydrolase [Planctomycetota bacterium]